MSLKNPETISEVVEKIMISCISANLELQSTMTSGKSLDNLKDATNQYNDYLADIRIQGIEMIEHIKNK